MADDTDDSQKTEQPTQRKLDEARKHGDVVKSQEVNTLILLASSAAMIAALRAMRRADGRALVERLSATAALGVLFLAVQGFEWARLIHYGLTVTSGAYGATFYTVIGIHAAHVVGALLWLGVTLLLAARGRYLDGEVAGLRSCATYWHYVVGLWPILYVAVYLA